MGIMQPPLIVPLSSSDISRILAQRADAGDALVMSGLIEDELEKLLLTAGRPLSNRTAKIIFESMGPLSSFSAKIEIAFMFELIDETVRDDLRIIKGVRNAFAHTARPVHFNSPLIAKQCWKLSNWKENSENRDCFLERARECVNVMKTKQSSILWIRTLEGQPAADQKTP
jgi:hypothetical protein